jgi:hypothetical protein
MQLKYGRLGRGRTYLAFHPASRGPLRPRGQSMRGAVTGAVAGGEIEVVAGDHDSGIVGQDLVSCRPAGRVCPRAPWHAGCRRAEPRRVRDASVCRGQVRLHPTGDALSAGGRTQDPALRGRRAWWSWECHHLPARDGAGTTAPGGLCRARAQKPAATGTRIPRPWNDLGAPGEIQPRISTALGTDACL